jgi:uncharacterized protein (DUF427 family)
MTESVWDYPRPPRVEPTGRRITVRHNGVTVADTREAVRVLETSHPPVYYLPRSSVVVPVRATGRRTVCEFKGVAEYWDLVVGPAVVSGAAWSYEDPAPAYEVLRARLAFYPSLVDECTVDGEVVLAQPGDFYGGWVTGDVVGPFKGGPGTRGW